MANVSGNEFDGIMSGAGSVVPEREHQAPSKKPSSRKLYLGGLAALVVVCAGGGLLMAKKKEAPPQTELDQLISDAEASTKAKPPKTVAAKAALDQRVSEAEASTKAEPPETVAAKAAEDPPAERQGTTEPFVSAGQQLAAAPGERAAEVSQPPQGIETSTTGKQASAGKPTAEPEAAQAPNAQVATTSAPRGIVSGVAAESQGRELARSLQRVKELEARLANERKQRSQPKVTVVAVLADGVVLRDGSGKEHVVAVGGAL